MLRSIPLSPLGWLALGSALTSAGLAVAALLLPRLPEPVCDLNALHTLPSGRTAQLCEVLEEAQPFSSVQWLVVRMVVPDLPSAGQERDHSDHAWACAQVALPGIADAVSPPARIVVQLMAEPFPRGEPAPGIIQSIEAYSIREGVCIWELL